ncbi:MAG: hypothetical protein R2825_02765 [Saprospiraceae bacterium]
MEGHYLNYISEIDASYKLVHEKILEYQDQLGKDFIEAGTSAFSFPLFYSKKKKIVALKMDVAKNYRNLEADFLNIILS